MGYSAAQLIGHTAAAHDGPVGRVVDILFDDCSWRVAHLVIETGKWFRRSRVVLDYAACELPSRSAQVHFDGTCEEAAEARSLDDCEPVSREMERYITTCGAWIPCFSINGAALPPIVSAETVQLHESLAANSLRSIREVSGYSVLQGRQHLGTLSDSLIRGSNGEIEALVVDQGGATETCVPVTQVRKLSWCKREVLLNADSPVVARAR